MYGLAERDKDILPEIQNLEKDSLNFNLWLTIGRKLLETKNFEPALECFDNAILLGSDMPDGWYYKGQTLLSSGNYEKAIESFDKVINIDPKNSDAWDAKGLALGRLGKEAEAKKCFDTSKQLKEDKIAQLIEKGKNSIIDGKYDDAVKSLDNSHRYRS